MDLFSNLANIALGKKSAVQPLFNSMHVHSDETQTDRGEFREKMNTENRIINGSENAAEKNSVENSTFGINEKRDENVPDTGLKTLQNSEQSEKAFALETNQSNSDSNEVSEGVLKHYADQDTGTVPDQGKNYQTGKPVFQKTVFNKNNINESIDFKNERDEIPENISVQHNGKILDSLNPQSLIKIPGGYNDEKNEINTNVLDSADTGLAVSGDLAERKELNSRRQINTKRAGNYNKNINSNSNDSGHLDNIEKKQTVQIIIGRIEVNAVSQQPKLIQKSVQKKQTLSLNEYLQKMNREKK